MNEKSASEKPSQRQSDRILIVLGFILFLNGVGGGVAFPIIPLIGPSLGVSAFFVSMILAGNRISRLLANGIVGDIVDRYGCRKPLLFGLLVKAFSVAGYAAALFTPKFPGIVFFSSRFLFGIGSAFSFITIYAILFHLTGEDNRGSRTAYIRTASLFGFPTGLALGGLIASYYSYTAAFLSSAGALFLFTFLAYLLIPELEVARGASIGPLEAVKLALADTRVLRISMVNLLEWFSIQGVFLSTTALYVEYHGIQLFDLGADGISGMLMAVMVMAKGISTLIVGRIIDGAQTRTYFSLLGAVMGGLAYMFWAIFPTMSFILLGLLLLGACSGIMSSPLLTLLGDVSRVDLRGRTLGVYRVFGDIGGTLGPIFGINLAAIWGFPVMYFTVALVLLSTLLFIGPLYRTEKRSAALHNV